MLEAWTSKAPPFFACSTLGGNWTFAASANFVRRSTKADLRHPTIKNLAATVIDGGKEPFLTDAALRTKVRFAVG